MDFIGYPLIFGVGSVYFANRYIYKRYFNPIIKNSPFVGLLKNNDLHNKKGFLTRENKFWADKTILMELQRDDIIDANLVDDEHIKNLLGLNLSNPQTLIIDSEKLSSPFQSSMDIFIEHLGISKENCNYFGEFLQSIDIGAAGNGATLGAGGKNILVEIRKQIKKDNDLIQSQIVAIKFLGQAKTQSLRRKLNEMYQTQARKYINSKKDLENVLFFVWDTDQQSLVVLQDNWLKKENLAFKIFKYQLETKIMPEEGPKNTMKIDLDPSYIKTISESKNLEILGFIQIEDDFSMINYESLIIGKVDNLGDTMSDDNNFEVKLGGTNGKLFKKEIFSKFGLFYV